MRTLLVLAGNAKQADQFIREKKKVLFALGLEPKYLFPKSFSYLGHRECSFTLVGTVHDAGYPHEMFAYFDSHGITNFTLK